MMGWWVGRSGKKKRKKKVVQFTFAYTLNLKFNLWDMVESDGERCISTRLSNMQLSKNVVSMLINKKDITSCQLLLIKQERGFVN